MSPRQQWSTILLFHSWFFHYACSSDLCRIPLRAHGLQIRHWAFWVISWGCRTVPEESPEHRWGWRSAGSWLCWPRPPSSSGSLPPSAAASPAWKTSRFLCRGAPPCGYCSVLQEMKPHVLSKLNPDARNTTHTLSNRLRPCSHQTGSPKTNLSKPRDKTMKRKHC